MTLRKILQLTLRGCFLLLSWFLNCQSREAPEQPFIERSRTKFSLITILAELGQSEEEVYSELWVMEEVASLAQESYDAS